jgi:hypothetical protein
MVRGVVMVEVGWVVGEVKVKEVGVGMGAEVREEAWGKAGWVKEAVGLEAAGCIMTRVVQVEVVSGE